MITLTPAVVQRGRMPLYRALLSAIAFVTCCQAVAQMDSATGNYYPALGYVLSDVRGTKWKEELCSEKFPDTKAKNVAAYAVWKARNAAFITEMEGQFAIIDSHWHKLAPGTADFASTIRTLSDDIDANKPKLKAMYQAHGDDLFREVCESYAARVTSPKFDPERALSDRVAIVRRGPN